MLQAARFVLSGDPAAAARTFGTAQWVLRMTDGTLYYEWQTDWLQVPTKGRQALRLYCPNGRMAEVGGTLDATGRLFQLKVAARSVATGNGAVVRKETLAHVIGMLDGTDGQCVLYAWEPAWSPAVLHEPVRRWLVDTAMRLGGLNFVAAPSGLDLETLDALVRGNVTLDLRSIDRLLRRMSAPPELLVLRERVRNGRLLGPLRDWAYALQYQNIGPLCAAHLGIAAA